MTVVKLLIVRAHQRPLPEGRVRLQRAHPLQQVLAAVLVLIQVRVEPPFRHHHELVVLGEAIEGAEVDKELGAIHHALQVEVVLGAEQGDLFRVLAYCVDEVRLRDTDPVHLVPHGDLRLVLIGVGLEKPADDVVSIRGGADKESPGPEVSGNVAQHNIGLFVGFEAVVEGELDADDVKLEVGGGEEVAEMGLGAVGGVEFGCEDAAVARSTLHVVVPRVYNFEQMSKEGSNE